MFNFWADFFRITYNITLTVEQYKKLVTLILKRELADARQMVVEDIGVILVDNYIDVDTSIYVEDHVVREYMDKYKKHIFKTTKRMISELDASDIVDTMFLNAHIL